MGSEYIDKLALIELKDKKILLALSYGKDKWYNPGGKRKAGETDEEALVREIKEELNVDIIPESIKYYGTFTAQAHGKPQGVMVRSTFFTAKYIGQPTPGQEVEKIDWLDYSKKDMMSAVTQMVFEDLKEKWLVG